MQSVILHTLLCALEMVGSFAVQIMLQVSLFGQLLLLMAGLIVSMKENAFYQLWQPRASES